MLVNLRIFGVFKGLLEAFATLIISRMVLMTIGTLCMLLLHCTGCKPVVSSAAETSRRSLFALKKVVSKLLTLVALKDSWKGLVFYHFEALAVDAEPRSNETILFRL